MVFKSTTEDICPERRVLVFVTESFNWAQTSIRSLTSSLKILGAPK